MKLGIGLCIFWLCINWSVVVAEDWPMWRGPRGNGVSQEVLAPLRWSQTENVRWRQPVPGRGLSSPIVIQGAVYLTTFMPEQQSRRLMKFDRQSGELCWDIELHRGPVEQQHRFNSCASSTPAADSLGVYAIAVDSEKMWVVATDHRGNQLWKVSPGGFASQHGFAASPVLYAGNVIVNGQQDGDAFLVALNCRTGQVAWSYKPTINLRSFSTPVVAQFADKAQLIVSGANQTVALSPDSGKPIWFAEGPNQKFVATPSCSDDMIFSFAGSPTEKAMAIRLGGTGDVSQTHVVWRSDKAMPYVPSPVLVDGWLHVINDSGIYSCIEPQTGKVVHSWRRGGNTYSSPIAAAGRVYLFQDSGRCTVIKNDASFEVLAVNELEEETQTTPAFSDGEMFVRSAGHLWCIKP